MKKNSVDNMMKVLNESVSSNEYTRYNSKAKKDFDNDDEYKSAIKDDISTIMDSIEELRHKMNTDKSVDILSKHLNQITSDLLED